MKIDNAESLVCTICNAWKYGALDCIISHVFTCLERVVCFINEGEGGNNLVETRRGPLEDVKNNFANNDEDVKDDAQDILLNDDSVKSRSNSKMFIVDGYELLCWEM